MWNIVVLQLMFTLHCWFKLFCLRSCKHFLLNVCFLWIFVHLVNILWHLIFIWTTPLKPWYSQANIPAHSKYSMAAVSSLWWLIKDAVHAEDQLATRCTLVFTGAPSMCCSLVHCAAVLRSLNIFSTRRCCTAFSFNYISLAACACSLAQQAHRAVPLKARFSKLVLKPSVRCVRGPSLSKSVT